MQSKALTTVDCYIGIDIDTDKSNKFVDFEPFTVWYFADYKLKHLPDEFPTFLCKADIIFFLDLLATYQLFGNFLGMEKKTAKLQIFKAKILF